MVGAFAAVGYGNSAWRVFDHAGNRKKSLPLLFLAVSLVVAAMADLS